MLRAAEPTRFAVAIGALLLTALALLVTLDDARSVGNPATVRLVGPQETVFDWSRDACRPSNYPDLPVRAFRDHRGRTQLLLSHFDNFRMIGRSLDRLRLDCRPVMRSGRQRAARRFDGREWIGSLYTSDGKRIWALVHNEYQGHRHDGRCPSGQYLRCWYNAITLARSDDGGRSYRHARPPRHLVASAPYEYRPDMGTAGVFTPSNIVRRPDGAYYALVRVRNPSGVRGPCLMRTRRLANPRGWRAWNGSAFGAAFADPYRAATRPRSRCAPVGVGEIAEMTDSLTYNTVLDRYLLVGLTNPGAPSIGPKVTGIYFSTSRDLIHWTPRKLVLAATRRQDYRCGDPLPIAYPSLVDPSSRSRTFATTGRRPFLYFTRFNHKNCRQTPDRDLIRVPVEISGP